jgi:hypothetical protein
LEYQNLRFPVAQLEHEIGRKTPFIAFDGFVEIAGGNAVKSCQIGIQQHLFASDQVNHLLDALNRKNLRFSGVIHVGFCCEMPNWNIKVPVS